jgi:hypothetical protein
MVQVFEQCHGAASRDENRPSGEPQILIPDFKEMI